MCSSGTLTSDFLLASLSGFGTRVMLAPWNEFGSVPFSSTFGRVWEELLSIVV